MASSYRGIKDCLEDELEVIPVELSGHGKRYSDGPCLDFDHAAADIYRQITDMLEPDDNFAILGHSMGAWLAYEVYYLFRKNREKLPLQLFLSGAKVPIGKEIVKYDQNDDDFVKLLASQGGTPAEVLNNKELLEFFVPIIRSDFRMLGAYAPPENREKVISKITVLCGESDNTFSPKDTAGWKPLAYQFSSYSFKGGHFFIYENENGIADTILNELMMNIM